MAAGLPLSRCGHRAGGFLAFSCNVLLCDLKCPRVALQADLLPPDKG